MKTVLIIGDLNLDIILTGIEDLPALGGEIIAQDHIMKAGGSAANVAAVLSMSGCPVRFFSRVGRDIEGSFVVNYLKQLGVKTESIAYDDEERTGITVSLAYPQDRIYITHAGTVASTRLEDFNGSYLSADGHLHLASFFLQTGLEPSMGEILKRAKKCGMSTSLDPGGDTSQKWDMSSLGHALCSIDWFLPNREELLGITKRKDIQEALKIFPKEVKGVVVKSGGEGAFVRFKGQIEHFPAFSVNVVDASCAGDCFNAGFIYGLMRGDSFVEAVKLGNRYGAEAVSTLGLPLRGISEVEG